MSFSVNMNPELGIPTTSSDYLLGINNSNSNDNSKTSDSLNINPTFLIIVSIVLVLYYVVFASLGNGGEETTAQAGKSIIKLEILLWSVFILLLLVNGIQYIFNINIVASIKNLFSDIPEIDIKVDGIEPPPVPEIKRVKQVFHVPGNHYTYKDAKAICSAYGARLATTKDMDRAYKNGADWCSYGWSEGQMAYFPTQYSKWDELQKIKGHENDCGRPGINGGFIDNENVRFGVNCFGYKPKMTNDEMLMMSETPLYPKTQEEIDFEHRVDFWKKQIPDIIVAPFNHNKWSVI
jgi:hypothetical protein